MFYKGTMKEDGIDITIKNNPEHVLAPDDWDMVMGVKFDKVTPKEYKKWYNDLIRKRWKNRKAEIIALAKEGMRKDIKLKCFCPNTCDYCHANLAADFLNKLGSKLQS